MNLFKNTLKTTLAASVALITSTAFAGDPIPGIDVSLEQVPGGRGLAGIIVLDPTNNTNHKFYTDVNHPDLANTDIHTNVLTWNNAVTGTIYNDTNWAGNAVATATTTFSGYDAQNVIDGSQSTATTGSQSWVNTSYCPSHQPKLQIDLNESRTIGRIEVFTSAAYPIESYRIEFYNKNTNQWVAITTVHNNTDAQMTHTFSSVYTDKVRMVALRGPAHQSGYCRFNEIELYTQ